jgi:hypothetical protein
MVAVASSDDDKSLILQDITEQIENMRIVVHDQYGKQSCLGWTVIGHSCSSFPAGVGRLLITEVYSGCSCIRRATIIPYLDGITIFSGGSCAMDWLSVSSPRAEQLRHCVEHAQVDKSGDS